MGSSPSRQHLDSMIATALATYDDAVRSEWARIRIEPATWRCSPYGDFWAVAVDDDRVLWFNDIEEGFNWSHFSSPGTIDEYSTNQTELTDILERIAQAISDTTRAALREGNVPAAIAGPGTIVRRQTTYWDVRGVNAAAYRIHFRDKVEMVFAGADYGSIEVAVRHPLLVQYDEPSRSLYFTGAPRNPALVAEHLERVIRDQSSLWRGLVDYTGTVETVARQLDAGRGKLMEAPASVCAAVAAVLETEGVQTSVLDGAAARPGKQPLVLGRSYVIASAFAFERAS